VWVYVTYGSSDAAAASRKRWHLGFRADYERRCHARTVLCLRREMKPHIHAHTQTHMHTNIYTRIQTHTHKRTHTHTNTHQHDRKTESPLPRQ